MAWPDPRWLLLAVAEACASARAEVVVKLPQGSSVALHTRGSTALVVRLHPEWHDGPFVSPMVHPEQEDAPYKEVHNEHGTGITSAVGSLLVSKRGTLILQDAGGRVLTESEPLAVHHPVVNLSTSPGAKLYGRGASPTDAEKLTPGHMVHPMVCNRASYAPYYYSSDGYALLGAANKTQSFRMPVVYHSNGTYISWHAWVLKGAFQLYFMPAETLAKGTQAYYALVGAPPVPPRWSFGFMASRWGWEDKAYVEAVVSQFRTGGFPIDAIIIDFEWFVTETDYQYPPAGKSSYTDFGYDPKLWPNPKGQLPYYRDKLHVRFGGLRKPRLGNTELLNEARAKGWLLPGAEPGGSYPPIVHASYAWHRNINFSIPEAREWYGQKLSHYLADGVEFWWNDEGETDYFTFYWWNVAEKDLLEKLNPSKRFYSLNRAWSPGMASLGATVWTGDIDAKWEDLRGTPGMMLNWALGGAPYVASDIGGFSRGTDANLLTRWMQLGAFLPTMRVHSVISAKPHWPWLWGPQAAGAMRNALEVRYRLLPYHYSLAHRMYESLRDPKREPFLWMRPLAMVFPEDEAAASLTTEWMDGDILVAPIVRPDFQKEVYLPKGVWYQRETAHISHGPLNIGGVANLWEIPQYCRAGAVIPVAPAVQFSDALPGGPLEIQVYGGADGEFELIEDDGTSYAYKRGEARRTQLSWSERDQTLTWNVSGSPEAAGSQSVQELYMTLFDGHGIRRTETKALGGGGSLRIGPQTQFV